MLKKVTAVATEFRRVSDQQMATTTKYTIEENIGLSRTVKGLEKTVAATLEENDQLRQKCKKQLRDLELLQASYNEAVKRKVQSEQVSLLKRNFAEQLDQLGLLSWTAQVGTQAN